MKKIKPVFIVLTCALGIYLLYAFSEADLNPANWREGIRGYCSVLVGVVAAMILVFMYSFDALDDK